LISLPFFEKVRVGAPGQVETARPALPAPPFEMLRRTMRRGARRIWPAGAGRQPPRLDERHQDLIGDLGEQLIGRR